ncbi:MAG: hypothetical protein WC499_04045 [Patescibacteria group bacterium]
MEFIKRAWNEGIDKISAQWLADMIAKKQWSILGFSALFTMGIMSFLSFMPVWYQIIACVLVTIVLGRVAWLAGKLNVKKS